jgi:hypothetical protein
MAAAKLQTAVVLVGTVIVQGFETQNTVHLQWHLRTSLQSA